MMMEQNEEYLKAKKRVHAVRAFYTHLMIYLIVNAILFLINLFNRSGGWWFFWPLIGWGIGVIFQGFNTFFPHGIFGNKWEEKKIREYLDKKNK